MKKSDSAVGGTMALGLSLRLALGAVMDNIPVYMTLRENRDSLGSCQT